MQNKQAIVGIGIAAIILVGAAGAFMLGKNKNSTQPNNTAAVTNTTNSTVSNGMMEGSIKDIFASGKTSKCTFDVTGTSGGETKGTIYTAKDKAYGDFDMTSNGKTTGTYLIRNGDMFYIWGDAFPTGIKMTMSMNEMSSKMQANNQYNSLNPSQKYSYKCSGWTVDPTKFTPPTNVKFMDTGSMMLSGTITPAKTVNTTEASSQCSVCNSLTGPAKTSCLASLNCK